MNNSDLIDFSFTKESNSLNIHSYRKIKFEDTIIADWLGTNFEP